MAAFIFSVSLSSPDRGVATPAEQAEAAMPNSAPIFVVENGTVKLANFESVLTSRNQERGATVRRDLGASDAPIPGRTNGDPGFSGARAHGIRSKSTASAKLVALKPG